MNENISYTTINNDISQSKIENNSISISDREVQKTEESNYVSTTGSLDMLQKVYGNDLKNKNPMKMGGLYTFCFLSNQPIICIGSQIKYPIILCLLFMLISYFLFDFIFCSLIIEYYYIALFLFISICTIYFYLYLVNPGIPNRKFYISEGVLSSIYTYLENTNSESIDKYKICKICNIYVPPELLVIHCEDCNICINGK